jgi:hypothetical protein
MKPSREQARRWVLRELDRRLQQRGQLSKADRRAGECMQATPLKVSEKFLMRKFG